MPGKRRVGRQRLPVVHELTAPDIDARGEVEVAFTYESGSRPVSAVDVEVQTALGTLRETVPGKAAGIAEATQRGALRLNLAALPAGRADVRVTLVDERRGESEPATIGLDVPGGRPGALGAVLGSLRPLHDRLTRPSDGDELNARFALAGGDEDRRLSALLVRVTPPDGEARLIARPLSAEGGELGEASLTLCVFRASDPLGTYAFSVTALDAEGNTGEPVETVIELVEDGGAEGPAIAGFEPAAGAAGEPVRIRGRALAGEGLSVLVGGAPADVVRLQPEKVVILAPPLEAASPIVVVTDDGMTTSEDELAPAPAIAVVPERFEIAAGGELQLAALVTGVLDTRVTWGARARRGGEAGAVSDAGIYTAPLTGSRGAITITATSVAAKVSASARATVVAHPPAPGPLRLGPLGGTALSEDGGCAVAVPRDALAQPATMGITTLGGEDTDADMPPETVVVAAARLEPAGLELRRPLTVTVPLRTYVEPETEVQLQARDDDTQRWADLDATATVVPRGDALMVALEQVQGAIRAVKDVGTRVRSPAPDIHGIEPTSIDEGATAAVLLTGRNFVPGVTTVTVHDAAGAPERRVEVRTVYVTGDGTKLGVTLKAGVMTDLGDFATREVIVRVSTPAGRAERRFTIHGHDELDIPAGAVHLPPERQAFSRLTLGPEARLSFFFPATDITVFERVRIGARFDAGGGLVDLRGGAGGAGVAGASGGRGGASGFAGGAPSARPAGSGGAGGGGFEFGQSGAGGPSVLTSPLTVVETGGGGGAGGAPGIAQAAFPGNGLPGTSAARRPVIPGLDPPFHESAGGGGGGGGGGQAGVLAQTGGGGGGGGDGGGALRLAAGEQIAIAGDILAVGGDGGRGALGSTFLSLLGGSGGSGGGGAGGCLHLHGVLQTDGFVLATGGRTPNPPTSSSGPLPVELRTASQIMASQPPSGFIRVDGRISGGLVVPAPFAGPDLDYVFDLVSPTAMVELWGRGTSGALQARVRDRLGNERPYTGIQAGPGPVFRFDALLSEGFNDVRAEFVQGPQRLPWITSAPVRSRRLLFLAGATPFFTFACSIGPATATVPAERTVDLRATVTGTSMKAVVWSVDGGAVNGAVDATARYTAPSLAPSGPSPVTVRATSLFDPSKGCSAQVTPIPGIEGAATAAVGTAGLRRGLSANVGQTLRIDIPPAVQALTNLGFTAAGQSVEFQTVQRSAAGVCERSAVTVQGAVAPDGKSLTVGVPPCAAGAQVLRVPGHGSVRLQVVPAIASLNLDPALGPNMAISGTGLVCGDTAVLFDDSEVSGGQVFSVTCTTILLGTRPAPGQSVSVRTSGGTSNALPA